MLDIRMTTEEFWNLSDEEQSMLCMALVGEYERLEKPLHDKAVDEYLHKKSIDRIPFQFHDWRRIRTNLKYYAEPNKLGENKSAIRWNTFWKLYAACEFLEYINNYISYLEEK